MEKGEMMEKIIYKDKNWKAVFMARGGILLRLQWQKKGFDILRFPRTYQEFYRKPEIWGIPLLFLPNRMEDGKFTFRGKEYDLGINEAKFHNFLHGFLHTVDWEISRKDHTLTGEYHFAGNESFPHPFTAKVLYTFMEEELLQEVTFLNTGKEIMPFLFGQHTAFRLPGKNSSIQISCGEREILLSGRHLPTGEVGKLTGKTYTNRSGKVSTHTWNVPEKDGFSGAVLTHPEKGVTIEYKVDPQYKFWMFWNYGGKRKMFCAEPQTCSVNAPNVEKLIPGGGNVIPLAPGKKITLSTSIKAEEMMRED